MTPNRSFADKSIKNSIYNVIGFIWPIGLSLAFTPYIIHTLGKEAYGILAIVSMVTGYFAFLNLGLGGAGLKYVAEYYAKQEYDTVNSVINILVIIYGILGILGLVSILVLTNLLATKVFKIPMDMINVTKFALSISAFGFLVTFIKSIFASIPKALHRFDIQNIISIIFGSASTLLVVLILYLGYGLKEVVVLRFVIGLSILLAFIMIVKKLLPFYRVEIILDKKLIKKLFSFGIFAFVTQISNISISQIPKLFIGILLGPATLTYFVVSQLITERINGFLFKLSEILFPIASELSSTNQHKRLSYIYLKMFRITLTIKLSFFIPLILFSYEILYYWMGKDFAEKGWIVMAFLCAGYFLISIGQIPGLINLGYGKPKNNAVYTFSITIIMLLTMYPLIKELNITGAAVSFCLSTLPVIIFVLFVNNKVIKISNIIFLQKACKKPIQAGLVQVVIISCIIKLELISNLGTLLLFLVISVISYFMFALIFGSFEKDERDHLFNLLKTILHRKNTFNNI